MFILVIPYGCIVGGRGTQLDMMIKCINKFIVHVVVMYTKTSQVYHLYN